MSVEQTRDPAMLEAIEISGGPAALARFITDFPGQEPITAQAICSWKKCPPRRAKAVEAATGSKVGRERLCPELFGPAPAQTITSRVDSA